MEEDLAGALDEAEIWYGHEMVSAADEFSHTEQNFSPSRGSLSLFTSPSRAGGPFFTSPLRNERDDPDDIDDAWYPQTPSRTSRAGSKAYVAAGRMGWTLGDSPSRSGGVP